MTRQDRDRIELRIRSLYEQGLVEESRTLEVLLSALDSLPDKAREVLVERLLTTEPTRTSSGLFRASPTKGDLSSLLLGAAPCGGSASARRGRKPQPPLQHPG